MGLGGQLVSIERGKKEVAFPGFIADTEAILSTPLEFAADRLLVEVAVTHKCEDKKIESMTCAGIPAIEIDLSPSKWPVGSRISEQAVREILHDPDRIRWLFHPNEAEARSLLKQSVSDFLRSRERLKTSPYDLRNAHSIEERFPSKPIFRNATDRASNSFEKLHGRKPSPDELLAIRNLVFSRKN